MDDRQDFPWLASVAAPLLALRGDDVVAINEPARHLFALAAERIVPLPLADVVGRDNADALAPPPSGAAAPESPVTLALRVGEATHRLRFTTKDLPQPAGHRLVTVLDQGAVPVDLDGEPSDGWAEKLPSLRDLLPNILNRLPVGLHIEDSSLRSVFFNDSFYRMFGYRIDEIARPEQWWPLVYPDPVYREGVQREWFGAVAEAQATNTDIAPKEWRVTCAGGEEKVIQFHCRRVGDYHVHAYVDVSARHRLDAELRHRAYTDALTGVANRRRFFDGATDTMAAGAELTVLLFDVDHFKVVNDRHGHAVGDDVLVAVAAAAAAELGSDGLLARVGGEEFAALLPSPHGATAMAERLRAAVARTAVDTAAGAVSVTVSVGLARRLPSDRDADAVMARADKALYAAKHAGRDRVRVA